MRVLKFIVILFLFILLTVLSQVGGIVLLLWLVVFSFFKQKLVTPWIKRGTNIGGFIIFYLLFNILVIPPLALIQGRVSLPFSKSGNLVPVTYWTAIFNRNYITIEGRDKLVEISNEFVKKHPSLKVKYMDCNYPFRFYNSHTTSGIPFIEGLFPHFTHTGDKADVALIYNDENGNASNLTPTAIGYGSSVEPLKGEPGYFDPKCGCITKTPDQKKGKDGVPCICDNSPTLKIFRMYSFMYRNIPINKKITLNNEDSRALIKEFIKVDKKIILEAHLRERLNILRFSYGNHSCKSVRHDDHFHVNFD